MEVEVRFKLPTICLLASIMNVGFAFGPSILPEGFWWFIAGMWLAAALITFRNELKGRQ